MPTLTPPRTSATFGACAIAGAALAFAPATTATASPWVPTTVVTSSRETGLSSLSSNTVVTSPSESLPPAPSQTPQEIISKIKSSTDLTWAQLADVFGVSRRTVHSWSSGSRLSAGNDEQLRAFGRLVSQIESREGVDPARIRSALMSPNSEGLSPIAQFRREHGARVPEPLTLESTVEVDTAPHDSFVSQ